MPANVETMFSTRVKPWHGIGTVLEECPNSEEALRLAGLDWKVEQKDVSACEASAAVHYCGGRSGALLCHYELP